jgi:hypothetical protein
MSQRRGIVDSIQAKASEVGKEDFDKAKTLVNDAARSGSYIYPIKVDHVTPCLAPDTNRL